MEVTSLDTHETIVFNKENLNIHTATYDKYKYGSREYYSLINKYPENEMLIQGILYPCDIDKAIEAKDGDIISYDDRYIEEQEYSLLQSLSDYCRKFYVRWLVPSYRTSDNLYLAANHAVLSLNLVTVLINERAKRCRTDEVHSFHIRQFLSSHFEINKHYEYLNKKQRLYLYRNIDRLSKFFGRNEIFLELTNKLLNDRNIPLEGYTVKHINELNDNLSNDIIYRRDSIINNGFKDFYVSYVKTDDFYDENRGNGAWTNEYITDNKDNINKLIGSSSNNNYLTKNLISDMVDYSNTTPFRLNEVLLSELVYMSYTNRYLVFCEFKDPLTNKTYQLNSKDCVTYLTYLAYKYSGVTLDKTTGVVIDGFLLDPLVSKDRLMSIADSKVLYYKEELVDYILSRLNIPKEVKSIKNFFNRCYDLYREIKHQWQVVSSIEDVYQRAEAEKIVNALFGMSYVKIHETDVDMLGWLNSKDLPIYDESPSNIENFMKSIFVSITGLDTGNNKHLPSILRSLIDLFKKLSSYSIVFNTEINVNPIISGNRVSVRHSTPNTKGYTEFKEDPIIEVTELNGIAKDRLDGSELTDLNIEISSRGKFPKIELDHIVDMNVYSKGLEHINHPLMSNRVSVYKADGTIYNDNDPFIGFDIYKSLTQKQISSIPN